MKLYFVTSNKNKLEEVNTLLGRKLIAKSLEIDEIQSIEVATVAADKAKRAYEILKKPLIVEDTGLYINSLNGFPGALSKWLEMTVENKGICRILDLYKDRTATAVTCIGFYDGRNLKIFEGRLDGSISKRPIGKEGFGWDFIFMPKGYNKTFAQLGIDKKNESSHRSKAVAKLKKYLDSIE